MFLSAVATALTLVGLPTALAQPLPGTPNQAHERLQQARARLTLHDQAMACGDPSRSPYHRFRGPVGQSGSRHGEQEWYRELTAQR
ncbi:MAG: hypothetical protein VKL97_02975 [Cyanobacteriota bacterium]|nr:hypothetical protein [Cyanobacteriota bacterium]